jgi:hypothetical protein
MKPTDIIIHIDWDGPYRFDSTTGDSRLVSSLVGPTDYGVYQIYGGHPVYGNTSLLYIGLAAGQHFGERVPQEKQWFDNRDAGRVEVYIGRLAGNQTPDDDTWDKHIRLAERLLIYSHSPTMNTQKNLGKLDEDLHHVHILNWARHRDLLPEVSGARWSSRFNDMPDYHPFSDEQVPDNTAKA